MSALLKRLADSARVPGGVFLAGPSAELGLVKDAAAHVESRSFVITEPWWLRIEEAARRGWATDAAVPDTYMIESAARNEIGILRAERVIVLCRSSGGLSSSCAYELGLAKWALAEGIIQRIQIVGDPKGHVGSWGVERVSSIKAAVFYDRGCP